MKIGIIGTGWVAGLHLDALRQIEDAEVVAIAGRNEARAKELAQPIGAKTYSEPLSMLRSELLDAVFILLPPHLHGDLERACSEHVTILLNTGSGQGSTTPRPPCVIWPMPLLRK